MPKLSTRSKVIIIVGTAVFVGLLVWQSLRHYEAIRARIGEVTGVPATYEAAIYFADFEYTELVAETRELKTPETPEERIRQAIEELIAGPADEAHSPTLPPETELISVFVKDGVATLNFSEEVQSKSFGTTGELFAVNSIYKTVVENEPSVFAVKLLVESNRQVAFNGENGTVYCDFAVISELGPTILFVPPPGWKEKGKG
ncbi:MAG: GerMN domain-containing protein [Candidatus Coatesbacteria bacterium]|nr:MAG: GerMN domain-containing protein [Candidatus Coatesbacteria bacterium]